MTRTVGFIGLGNIGLPMAANLARAGHRVLGFDLSADALQRAGAEGIEAASSASAIADTVDTVLLSLPTPGAVEAAVLGAGGLAGGSALRRVVDLSTSGPRMGKRMTETMAARGVDWLDAPVSGGVGGARAASLAIMVSGPLPAFAEVEPLLSLLGKLFHVGEGAGLAQTMKLVNNMVSGAALAITAEAMAMGAKAGLDPAVMIDVLNAGSGRNTATLDKFPKSVLTGSFDFGFATALMLKDTSLFIDEAEAMGLSLRTADAVRQAWFETMAELGPSDFTAIAQLQERRAGISLRAGGNEQGEG